MSTVSPNALPELLEWIPGPLYRTSLEKYEARVDSGVFDRRDRLHLLKGFLVAKRPQSTARCTADERCGVAPGGVMPAGWYLRPSKPIRLPSQISKPEPDRCVVRGMIRDYSQRSPEPGEVALIVEVADSSLAEDRMPVRIHGGGGIPDYWIVNLVNRRLEVDTRRYADGDHARRSFATGEHVPVILDGIEVGQIAVADMLA